MSDIKRKTSLKKKKGLFFKLTECYQAGTNIRLRLLWGRTRMGERGLEDGTIGGGYQSGSNVGLYQEALRIMDNIWIHLGAIKMS